MNEILGQCPVCGEVLEVTRLHCRACDTAIEGHFNPGRLSQLTPDQLAFVEVFLRKEGKINSVCKELGVSYPTVRGRLLDVIAALGYQVEEETSVSEDDRRQLLDDLAAGKLSSEEVIKRLGSS